MASDVEEPKVETKGYFRLGFGSFLPHSPLRHQLKKITRKTGHGPKGSPPQKQALSLPAIHVSKLKERPPRKQTQSLKAPKELPGSADYGVYRDTTKKGLLPSLAAASCALPKMTGVAHRGPSWWEWSNKEYQIKQTRFEQDRSQPGEKTYMYSACDYMASKKFTIYYIIVIF